MLENANDIALLLWKHLNRELSSEEQLALDNWSGKSAANETLLRELDDSPGLQAELKEFDQMMEWFGRSLDVKFEKALPVKVIEISQGQPPKRPFFGWVAAASIFVVTSIAAYLLFFNNRKTSPETLPVVKTEDVQPGGFKAKLLLASGAIINLEAAKTGELTKEGNTSIFNKDGQLVYTSNGQLSNSETLHNTLSTGRGETYPIVLSDGSKVHLNNETELRFPVRFSGSTRVVELKGGQAFFEVAHNPSKPFKVILNGGTEVEVLGTQFAVQNFPGSQMETSLLSGKVKVRSPNSGEKVLIPGQQAKIEDNGNISIVNDADVEGSIAWVRGYFHFEEANMEAVLQQLARWYDVEVTIHGQISNEKIKGEIQRNLPLSEVLSYLEPIGNVKLKMEGKKIIVNP
jgi:transmembrane sensor